MHTIVEAVRRSAHCAHGAMLSLLFVLNELTPFWNAPDLEMWALQAQGANPAIFMG